MDIEELKIFTANKVCAGVDEAGRGPLVGGVYAAAVILDDKKPISYLNDSKKISEKKRQILAEEIKAKSLAYCIASASAKEIDELNIHNATLLAMHRSIEGLKIMPEIILIDGKFTPPNLDIDAKAIIKGDALFSCISAASILAKTARDASMVELDAKYPQYGFAQHKGYPTKLHLQRLQENGIIEGYRKSYAPVAKLI